MNDKLYPIGSVVLLKEANKRIMITGYYPTIIDEEKETTYDYCGCLFPEGVVDSSESMLFNHIDIVSLFYYGLMDGEQKDFMDRLIEAVEEEQREKILSTNETMNTNQSNIQNINTNFIQTSNQLDVLDSTNM